MPARQKTETAAKSPLEEAMRHGGNGRVLHADRSVERALEEFIARKYEQTREFVRTHPFGSDDDTE